MENWPHLQDIEGSLSSHLSGKMIALVASGSVACLELHRLSRTLVRHGAKVQIFLTQAASELVSPKALAWCVGRPVITHLTARCEHLEYFGKNGVADLLLLAPATANTIGKFALGLDDNVATTCLTTALGTDIPILCAPGMHEPMMESPVVLKNLELLDSYGVEILTPKIAEGKAKMMGTKEIVARVLRRLGPGDLAGLDVLLTGGPTREFIDPARCVTNPSSGLTACLLAEEVYRRGGKPHLVYGPGSSEPAEWLSVDRVTTAEEMNKGVEAYLKSHAPAFMVGVAAVADFKPRETSAQKLPSSAGDFTLELEPTPKILQTMRQACPQGTLVAFKAASATTDEELQASAAPYLEDEKADWVVANSIVLAGHGFDSPRNRYLLCQGGHDGLVLGPAPKSELAVELWDSLLQKKNSIS